MTEALSILLTTLGLAFFVAGSVGLLRLPDLYSRLHALTKADNVGLGLLVAGLVLMPNEMPGLKAVLVWLLTMASSATAAHLIARHARRREQPPWST